MRSVKIPLEMLLGEVGFIHTFPGGRLDFKKLKVTRNKATLHITKSMWRLLALLISNQGEVVSREAIMSIVFDTNGTTRSCDTFIAELRSLLGPCITTHHGIGYSWAPNKTPAPAPPNIKKASLKR